MRIFEDQRLYNPEFTQENRLKPRATVIPSLHKGVFYRNRLDSELILDLNGEYSFCYREKDDIKDFYRLDFEDGEWDSLPVPSMWQYHGYSAPLYPNVEYPIPFVPPYVGNRNPVGYYRKRFTASSGGRKILYLGGVDSAFFVYLNGEYVGFSKGSRMPAEFDVTSLICDGENLLCVKVFTYSDGTYLENQDMLLASGIFRDVMLYTLNDTFVWDYCIRTEGNTLFADVTLNGDVSEATAVRVAVGEKSQTVFAQARPSFRFDIEEPVRWNAEQPYTYELTIELLSEDNVLEIHTKRVGFAEFTVEGNKLLLDGRQITLKGVNRHEHDPKNGRAITVEQTERELRLIKSHNFNAIRCSHYPNNPAFYELCTELGIYVMNEADIETHGAYVCGDMGYFSKHPRWLEAYCDRVSRMYERDKNETCISIWTLGNENGDGENLHKCFEYLKSRSVKKPVMHTGDNGREPVISDFRAFGYFTMETLMSFPKDGKPVMMLEYGHAMGNSPGLMKDTWDYVYRHRHICGGYVWEFKNHGFYAEDEEGNAFYKYGGDFGDINHWSNFSMDGYCLSDGTPKPSLRECKNILSPTYVTYENGKILLTNTNDFRALDYVTLRWELCEDYITKRSGEMRLPSVAPYETVALEIDTAVGNPEPGAEYFVNLHFYDDSGAELAFKQVSLGILEPKPTFVPQKDDFRVERKEDHITVGSDNFEIKIENGMLSYVKKDGAVLLDSPMTLNLYRAPIDNDGIVGWSERWIKDWKKRLYPYFEFVELGSRVNYSDSGSLEIKVVGKWAPISKFGGFDVNIVYTVMRDGNVLVDIHGTPYGKFAETIPRLGVFFELDSKMDNATWYGRGEDECYVDRCEHCNFGLYTKKVDEMNFMYDVPQECGTRVDTRFVKIFGGNKTLSVIGSETFSFSYHDFTLSDLIEARHRNELKKSDKNYLYIDYAMRGLGSKSCGPDPEECYELRAHEFRFAFMLSACSDGEGLLELSRKRFDAVTEKLGETHIYDEKRDYVNIVECNKE
ncbi:MAG: hypothetical protein E7607_07030 [Ruminococcaceae bacterium]|nr:hypothetical protein [Oscillospiraceae bacterium]